MTHNPQYERGETNLQMYACHRLRRAMGLFAVFAACLMAQSGCVLAINATESGSPSAHAPSGGAPPTVIYLVRHAEKEKSSPDPQLSIQGRRRAEALKRFLAHEPIDALLSSDYLRTKATLEPLARDHDLEIGIYDAGDPAALVATVLDEYAGKRVVVAGHSNTVPDLVGRLTSASPQDSVVRADLEHDEYERIFVVIRYGQGTATLLKLAYPGIGP